MKRFLTLASFYWAALAAGCSALGFERPMAFDLHNRCNFPNIFNFRPIESHPDGIRVQARNSASRQVRCPKRLMMQIKGTLKTCGWFLNSLSYLNEVRVWWIFSGGIVVRTTVLSVRIIKNSFQLMVTRVKVNI